MWPSNPATGHTPLENHGSKGHKYSSVYCSTIYNSQEMKSTLMSIDGWMKKLVCMYIQWNIQFRHSVMSDSLQPHGLQHASLPCPSPTPGACSNSCLLNLILCRLLLLPPSIFPRSGSFSMNPFFVQVVKALEFQFQHQSFQFIFRTDFL